VNVHDSAVERIRELRQKSGKPGLWYSIRVDGGGCSGFRYIEEIVDRYEEGDVVFADSVVTDEMSLPYLNNSEIRFDRDLDGARWNILNPNSKSGCGCGGSFGM
jgi:iron-sulfur cluster assembly accessory protein